jgi:hypothetical protein
VAGCQDEKKQNIKSSKERRKEKRDKKFEQMKRTQEIDIKGRHISGEHQGT